jgi:hypothetical protein
MGTTLSKYCLPFLFISLLVLVVANQFFKFWDFDRIRENRVYNDEVTIKLERLDPLPADVDSFVNDNFSFRSPLITIYRNYKLKWLRVSPVPDLVAIGQDGWCYMANNYSDIFSGKKQFNEKQLDTMELIWKKRTDYFKKNNITVYWLWGPIKNSIYPEHMPFNIHQSDDTRTKRLYKRMQAKFPGLVINPTDTLLAEKANNKLYYKQDNHWNTKTGSIVSKFVRDRMVNDHPKWRLGKLPQYAWKDSVFIWGNLTHDLGVGHLEERDSFPIEVGQKAISAPAYGFESPSNFPYPWLFEQRFVNKTDSDAPRVLFIRDSYAGQLQPFIKESFSESLFIFDGWHYQMNRLIIEKYKPDVVVFVTIAANFHLVMMHDKEEYD